MGIERRNFLRMAAAFCAGAAIPSCASAAMTRATPIGGVLRLPLRNHPQLDRPGGSLRVLPEGSTAPVYILAMDGGGYVALSPICTHLGCTVDIRGEHLICPCDGSTYDRVGRVLRGPAERSLRQYPLAFTPQGELIIEIGG